LGTFHQNRGELHGITVAVETNTGEFWIGRCDIADARGVLLHDADVHRSADEPTTPRAAFLSQALAVGVWPRHADVTIPAAQIASLRKLAELG
jgi:hypothetical protein